MSSGFKWTPRWAIMSRVSRITVRVRRPRKSIFKRPSFSMMPMGNWVVITSSFFCRGTYLTAGSRVISTPAAWVEAWRGMPSSVRAVSIRRFTRSSVSYMSRSSLFWSMAFSSVMSRAMGTALATVSTSA